jgi:cytochrome c-type biogenesis protein CcmH/NrfG
MLAFIGHLASTQVEQKTLDLLKRPLFEFVVGTFLSVIATAFAYFVQEAWIRVLKCKYKRRELEQATPADDNAIRKAKRSGKNSYRAGWILKGVAIICGVAALAAFGFGSFTGYQAFEQLNTKPQVTTTTPAAPPAR